MKKNNLNIYDTLVRALIKCQVTQNWLQSIYATLNCMKFQGLSREEFMFRTDDKAVNILCIIVKMYVCEKRGQEKHFFIETLF